MGVKQQYAGHHHEYVEVDPTGRYGRYNEILGKGASKIVYRAFDEYEGIEVAWNQVKLNDLLRRPEDLERLQSEIHLLKTLEHKHIMKFYTSWVDASRRNINFVTELFTSGTLRQYRQKHKSVHIRAVKHWCRQILKGLLYLHSHDPPIIHRDLKCDNIFVNGNQGVVKIGDLGLASILRKSKFAHCVGTPEFMAPEVYGEEYNELVDIYSFGMCLLEIVTFDYPYSECTHPVQIYKKVISGIKPAALYRIKHLELRQFVGKCLATASQRPSAEELLKDPFLQVDHQGYQEGDIRDMCLIPTQPSYDLCSIGSLLTSDLADDFLCETKTESWQSYNAEMKHLLRQPSRNLLYSNGSLLDFADNRLHRTKTENKWSHSSSEMQGIHLLDNQEAEQFHNVNITIRGTRSDDGGIFLRFRIIDQEGHVRNIHFAFDIEVDTASSVATEMVRELEITDYDVTSIAEMIDEEVSSLVRDWKQGIAPNALSFPPTSFSDTQDSSGSFYGSVMDYLRSSSLQSSHCSGLDSATTDSRFEETAAFRDEGSEQCVTEGAPGLSSSQSEANDFSSHGSRESHSDEDGKQLNETVNNSKEIHADSNQHEDSEDMKLRVEEGDSYTSSEKTNKTLRLGKCFSFNFPPRRNLFSKSKSFEETRTNNSKGSTCEVSPESGMKHFITAKSLYY